MATVESEQAFPNWEGIGRDREIGPVDHGAWALDLEMENQPLDVDLTGPDLVPK
jgi:hypothetical protein